MENSKTGIPTTIIIPVLELYLDYFHLFLVLGALPPFIPCGHHKPIHRIVLQDKQLVCSCHVFPFPRFSKKCHCMIIVQLSLLVPHRVSCHGWLDVQLLPSQREFLTVDFCFFVQNRWIWWKNCKRDGMGIINCFKAILSYQLVVSVASSKTS